MIWDSNELYTSCKEYINPVHGQDVVSVIITDKYRPSSIR